jgi:hypothetical protein
MEVFAGSMIGIRNPHAHENLQLDLNRAKHLRSESLYFRHGLYDQTDVPISNEGAVRRLPSSKRGRNSLLLANAEAMEVEIGAKPLIAGLLPDLSGSANAYIR